ncbi:hypothetical protein [Brucella melitensis]|uniref:hypothetical protein n=1 Tax=Brucella melitensis TaxID=29459 RepID=UPI0025A17699|nr:hypothetical protein [Brucella melitensis]MDM7900763.1 hypothetical protein [Brucella melitensis]
MNVTLYGKQNRGIFRKIRAIRCKSVYDSLGIDGGLWLWSLGTRKAACDPGSGDAEDYNFYLQGKFFSRLRKLI